MSRDKDTRDEVIDVLREGRVTPRYVKEQTSIESKQNAQYHLRQLRAEGRVEKVTRGLYELTKDPRMDVFHENMETLTEALLDEMDPDLEHIDVERLKSGDDAGDAR